MTRVPTETTAQRAAALLRSPTGRRTRWALLVGVALLALHANRMESRDVAVDLNQRVVRLGGTAHTAVELVSDGGLVLLAMTVLVVARQARRRGARAFATVVSGSLGTVAALAGSELLKAVHAQQRPCQAMPAVEPLVACPPPGDWSLPSNHAVLAAAAATVIVLTAPGLWRLVVPLAVAVAASRVAAGVHYPHDVMDGLLLGAVIVLIAVLAIRRPVERLLWHVGVAGSDLGTCPADGRTPGEVTRAVVGDPVTPAGHARD